MIELPPNFPEPEPVVCPLFPTPGWHFGDVVVNGQGQADQYASIHSICGNLTVQADHVAKGGVYVAGQTFSMPNLRYVASNVHFDADRTEHASLPKLATVRGNLEVRLHWFAIPGTSLFNTVDLAALERVGRDLDISTMADEGVSGDAARLPGSHMQRTSQRARPGLVLIRTSRS